MPSPQPRRAYIRARPPAAEGTASPLPMGTKSFCPCKAHEEEMKRGSSSFPPAAAKRAAGLRSEANPETSIVVKCGASARLETPLKIRFAQGQQAKPTKD